MADTSKNSSQLPQGVALATIKDGNDSSNSKHLKPSWAIALLEAKLGLEPSIPEAKSAIQYTAIDALFSPGEIKDADNEPSRQELMNKIAELKGCQTLKKIAMFRKELFKGVSQAKSHETQRLFKHIKKLKSEFQTTDQSAASAFEHDLALTKSLDVNIFTDRLVTHTIRKSKPLAEHPQLKCYALKDSTAQCDAFLSSDQEKDAEATQKITQRLTSSKSLASCVSAFKNNLFVYLGLRKDPNQKKSLKKKETEFDEPKPKKAKTKDSKDDSSKKAESKFVTSLGDFDEEDDEFKKLYGIKGKNRPGQRHRRKIYEQEFGEEANHVKSKIESNPHPQKPSGSSKPKPEEKLHPSWEAKRKQKLLISMNSAPKNNKIVFD
ncbi:hypothetical protein DSO57_1001803 [Entomophthora muscae]|uniref:Uncharacterized protein n=1 Tax=Entomophthora muscae TaxID=34485 RepID=A0ACC2U6T4_9FUNG|nr:hypothetical protein DSO57_1001803 [Entomophthora muscae]